MDWLAKQHEEASQRAPIAIVAVVAVEASIPARDKGKRNIVDCMEEEQRCKFRADSLVEKSSMAIEAKRH